MGSDERTHLTDFIEQELRNRGHHVQLVEPSAGAPLQWTDVPLSVAERVSPAHADEGDRENTERPKELDRQYRVRGTRASLERGKGRV